MIEVYLVFAIITILYGWAVGAIDYGIRGMYPEDWAIPIVVGVFWPLAILVAVLLLIEELLRS